MFKVERQTKVYNFEVQDNHNFYVSTIEVLVHNNCWGGDFFYKGFGRQKAIGHIWANHSFVNKIAGKSNFSSTYNTKSSLKALISSGKKRAHLKNIIPYYSLHFWFC